MATLSEVQRSADQLSREDRSSLLAHLIHSLPDPPDGADDDEVMKREDEMDSGAVTAISHEEFVVQARRKNP